MRIFKQITEVILAGLLLFQGTAIAEPHAHEESTWTEFIYDGLDNHQVWIVPLVNGGVGAFMGGKWSALIGFSLGALDEWLVNAELEEAYYFSAAFLGAAAVDQLELPYHTQHAAGAIGGVGLASGQLDTLKQYAASLVEGGVNGFVYAGTPGAVAGFAGCVLDEGLKASNVTDGAYAAQVLLSLAQAKALGTAAGMLLYLPIVGARYSQFLQDHPIHQGATEAFGLLILAIRLYPELTQAASQEKPTEVAYAHSADEIIASFDETLSQILDPEVFHRLMQRQAIVLVAIPLMGSQLSVSLYRIFSKFDTQLASFKTLQPIGGAPFSIAGKAFFDSLAFAGLFVVPYVGEQLVAGIVNDYQGQALASAAQDTLQQRLSHGEMALQLARHNETAALIDAMEANVYSIATTGEVLLSKIAESVVKRTYGLSILSVNRALDFAVLAQLLDDLTSALGERISQMQNENQQAQLPWKSRLSTLHKEWHKNPRDIVYGDRQELLAAKEAEALSAMRKLYREQALLGVASTGFFVSKDILLNFVVKYGFMGRKMLGDGLEASERLAYDRYPDVAAGGRGYLEASGWYAQNAGKVMEFNQATTNVKKIIGFMEQKMEHSSSLNIYMIQSGEGYGLKLTDFSVGHDEVTLLKPQTLEIPQGIYVVSGASGSGKTSFLSKIQGIKSNAIWSTGQITYITPNGTQPRIHQATQTDYIVPYTTLFEIITSRVSVQPAQKAALEARVKALLVEIQIDDKLDNGLIADLHVEKDWASILSGGQKRKVAIIGTILKEPNLMILDEVFNGLDADSVKNVQRMLKKYLPNTLTLIVDHNHELNNYDSFYDGQLHLEAQQLMLRKL